MSAFDEERLAKGLRSLRPPPGRLIRAAQGLPGGAGDPDVEAHAARAAESEAVSPRADVRLDAALTAVLDEVVGERAAAPSVAALVVSMAAALVEDAARRSRGEWGGAGGAVAQAQALRARAAGLAAVKGASGAIAEAAADVSALSALVVEHGVPAAGQDARAASLLAQAGAEAALGS